MSDKPEAGLNLDSLEREGTPAKPFPFTAGGKRYVVEDIEDADWRLLASDSPRDILQAALRDEQFASFASKPLPLWKIKVLAEAIVAHFGLGEPGEGDASSGS